MHNIERKKNVMILDNIKNHDFRKIAIDVFNIFLFSNISQLFLPLEISHIWFNFHIKG